MLTGRTPVPPTTDRPTELALLDDLSEIFRSHDQWGAYHHVRAVAHDRGYHLTSCVDSGARDTHPPQGTDLRTTRQDQGDTPPETPEPAAVAASDVARTREQSGQERTPVLVFEPGPLSPLQPLPDPAEPDGWVVLDLETVQPVWDGLVHRDRAAAVRELEAATSAGSAAVLPVPYALAEVRLVRGREREQVPVVRPQCEATLGARRCTMLLDAHDPDTHRSVDEGVVVAEWPVDGAR